MTAMASMRLAACAARPSSIAHSMPRHAAPSFGRHRRMTVAALAVPPEVASAAADGGAALADAGLFSFENLKKLGIFGAVLVAADVAFVAVMGSRGKVIPSTGGLQLLFFG